MTWLAVVLASLALLVSLLNFVAIGALAVKHKALLNAVTGMALETDQQLAIDRKNIGSIVKFLRETFQLQEAPPSEEPPPKAGGQILN